KSTAPPAPAPAPSGPTRPTASAPPTPKGEIHTQRFEGDKELDDVAGGKATIKAGEKSLQVTKIQQALVDLGRLASTKVTGTFAPDTTAALKASQHKATISETGVVDAATMDALRKGFDSFKPQRDVALDPATAKDPMAGTRTLNDDERKAISGVLN